MPASAETVANRMHYVKQDGQQVFKYAVRKMEECSRDLLERNQLTVDDVAVMIPHQANRRIIAGAAERLGINCDRVVINIDQYGNTTGATIPLATRDACAAGSSRRATWCCSPRWAPATRWAQICGAGRCRAVCQPRKRWYLDAAASLASNW